jgi:hypothetical protein
MVEELTIEFVQEYLKNTKLELHSTHEKVSFPILYRIYGKLKNGERFGPISVDDAIIVDGHHRYICHHILGITIETKKWTRSFSISSTPWDRVIVDPLDYDNPLK